MSPEINPAAHAISNGSFSGLRRPEREVNNPPYFRARRRMSGAMPPPVLLGGRNSVHDTTYRYGLDGPRLKSR
jgi:hypothetical protein